MIDRRERILIEAIKRDSSRVRIIIDDDDTSTSIGVRTKKFKHDVALAFQQSIIDFNKEIRRNSNNRRK